MPLDVFNDAVGPMARTVHDVALALDLVTGMDPDDAVTADAGAHAGPSFAAALASATLTGTRIGVLRQRFVGVTGEREAAGEMERVLRELRGKGAIVLDVTIPAFDEEYLKARGRIPGSLKAAWDRYLARATPPGENPPTVEGLLASGKLAPAGQRRLEGALEVAPTGAALEEASRQFIARREAFRQVIVDAMDAASVAVLLYPANQARPHTHEGGWLRYGAEPGTCEESAATGLPQVTVPAGMLAGRYPMGISFLGRMWDDRTVLGIAHAYEQATQHRRTPALR
jgi:Asp-tRNA(Asn)/Glu-tRNA(Gln) amidotransferase A subunit family amidase